MLLVTVVDLYKITRLCVCVCVRDDAVWCLRGFVNEHVSLISDKSKIFSQILWSGQTAVSVTLTGK